MHDVDAGSEPQAAVADHRTIDANAASIDEAQRFAGRRRQVRLLQQGADRQRRAAQRNLVDLVGHTKAEYFSSGFERLLIAGAAVGIIWAAIHRFVEPQPLQALGWGIALAVVSSALNGVLAWRMLIVSRQRHSIALEADARHLITDVWTSVGVVVGLFLVTLTGWVWLDPVLAIGVALNILREGSRLAWRSVEGLMDTAVEPDVRSQIDRTLAQFAHPAIRFDHVVTRRAGQRRFLDLHMHMPASWTLGRAAALRSDVEQALMSEVPGLRASIQLLPSDVEAHFNDPVDPQL